MGTNSLVQTQIQLEPITSTRVPYWQNEWRTTKTERRQGRQTIAPLSPLPYLPSAQLRGAMHTYTGKFHALSIKCSMNNNDSLAIPDEAGAVGVELNLDYILPIPYSLWWT